MNVLIGSAVLLIVVVGVILAVSQEFGKGAEAAKGALTLVVQLECAEPSYEEVTR